VRTKESTDRKLIEPFRRCNELRLKSIPVADAMVPGIRIVGLRIFLNVRTIPVLHARCETLPQSQDRRSNMVNTANAMEDSTIGDNNFRGVNPAAVNYEQAI
tara:strand:- start:9405 stop:9710 length:306 start_codon:yes stop_codon:yes gene_type:complete